MTIIALVIDMVVIKHQGHGASSKSNSCEIASASF